MNDVTAVDHDVLSLQVFGTAGREVEREVGDLVGFAETAGRHAVNNRVRS